LSLPTGLLHPDQHCRYMCHRRSGGYRAAKFIHRYRTARLAAILIGLSLVAGMWEAHVARLERDRAERRFTDMRQLAGSVIFDLQNRLAHQAGSFVLRVVPSGVRRVSVSG
jgi:hypothetical protein